MKRTHYSLLAFIKRLTFSIFIAVVVCTINANAQTGPFSLFDSENPSLQGNDGQPLETGFKFRVTQVGTISAIRFYKLTANGDNTAYTVNLWTNGNSGTPGTNLRTANSSTITGTGWKSISITPATLTPNIVYVISMHSSSGWYTFTNNYFPTTPDDYSRPPFVIVANNDDPAGVGNGVWRYTATSAFPFNTGNTTNYYIDLVFNTTFALPVTLSGFKATPSNNNIAVNWKTNHESNNKGFDLQRSNNGSDWYSVTFIDGAGESSVTRNYGYTDKNLAPGTYYYRVNQLDFDGKSSYSEIVSATITGKGAISLFQNYPNPFTASTSIRFDLPSRQHARLSIVDLAGREIRVLTDKVSEAGSHIITLNGANLGRQTYLVRLQTESTVLTKKIVLR
jgi:hypothetical protein